MSTGLDNELCMHNLSTQNGKINEQEKIDICMLSDMGDILYTFDLLLLIFIPVLTAASLRHAQKTASMRARLNVPRWTHRPAVLIPYYRQVI